MRLATRSAGVFTASYDLLARAYLGGPLALTAGRLPLLNPLLGALGEIDPHWPDTVTSLIDHVGTDPDGAEREFLQCVATPVPGRCVPPYASVYLDGSTLWGPSTFEVLRWYEAEGLAWDRDRQGAAGTRIVAPDHLGVEMAFLSVLSDRHAANLRRGASAERLRAALGHLAAWLPRYRDALAGAEEGSIRSILSEWAGLAASIVATDLEGRWTEAG